MQQSDAIKKQYKPSKGSPLAQALEPLKAAEKAYQDAGQLVTKLEALSAATERKIAKLSDSVDVNDIGELVTEQQRLPAYQSRLAAARKAKEARLEEVREARKPVAKALRELQAAERAVKNAEKQAGKNAKIVERVQAGELHRSERQVRQDAFAARQALEKARHQHDEANRRWLQPA